MLYHLFVYVPKTHASSVKEALFTAGAGRYKDYDRCCFSLDGTGEFRALEGANPFIGDIDKSECVDEVKLEFIIEASKIKDVSNALRTSHPYEEIAHGIVEVKTIFDFL